MAPELLTGAVATPQSDVYSLGCVLYELCHGGLSGEPASTASAIDARFLEVLDRCLTPDLTRRYSTAVAVHHALEQVAASTGDADSIPHGNPFRGLQPFDSQHRGLFLGRSSEAKAIVERLRRDTIVVVAGDSGVGKSSLCKAGVLPLIADSGVQIDRGAVVLRLQVGRDPIGDCATVLWDFLTLDPSELRRQLAEEPTQILRALARSSSERTIVLFIDQIEELFTLATSDDASTFATMLASLTLSGNQLRVLATVSRRFSGAPRSVAGNRTGGRASAVPVTAAEPRQVTRGHRRPRNARRRQQTLQVRLELAERMHNRELAGELEDRVRTLAVAGAAPSLRRDRARLTLLDRDPTTAISIARYRTESSGRLTVEPATPFLGTEQEVATGSYVLEAATRGSARIPVLLGRGQHETVQLVRPPEHIPEGFVFVPGGKTLVGSDEENMRVGLDMPPLHAVWVKSFLIGRFEVTMAQYIEWLETLDRAERAARLPANRSQPGAIELRDDPAGWTLRIQPTTKEYVARWGELIRYPGRTTRSLQDWRRFPVTGISFDDAAGFAAWLDRSRRVPGAHICTELEWTRAGRGADGRIFTTGRRLEPAEANFDLTYGGADLAFGPDEVGSHPESTSLFGVEDLHGNADEIVAAARWTEVSAVYGGSWYHERVQQRLDNRFRNVPTTRHLLMGVRLCAYIREGETR